VTPEAFWLETRKTAEGVVVSLFGELDLATVDQLQDELDRLAVAGRMCELVIDLRELDFLDSTGLRLLLQLHSDCQGNGCSLGLVPGRRAIQKTVRGDRHQRPFRVRHASGRRSVESRFGLETRCGETLT
jgi:anti-anti-sigma factor